jgi:hypothetical protein
MWWGGQRERSTGMDVKLKLLYWRIEEEVEAEMGVQTRSMP